MPIVIPPGYAQITFHMNVGPTGRPAICTLGIAGDGIDAATLAFEAGAAWGGEIMPAISDMVSLEHTSTIVGNDGDPFVGDSSEGASDGGQSGQPANFNTSILFKKTTALGGRKNRGRMFLPGVMESSIADGAHLGSGDRDTYQSAFESFASTLGSSIPELGDLVILHSDATVPTTVTSVDCQTLLATQRRRLRK